MDFYRIKTKESKQDKVIQAYPDWVVGPVNDLMVRGGSFYAIWDEEVGMWSTNELDVQRVVDSDLRRIVDDLEEKGVRDVIPLLTKDFGSGSWERFNRYIRNLPLMGNYHPLDENFTFANTAVSKKDYVSKRLPYALAPGKTDAWDELLSVLYSPEERDKIEWCIGAIVAGDSKWIQKFLVFYGAPATGKSTVIDVISKLFHGYTATFEAKALTGSGSFGMDAFEHNPLVALQHDGDLSRIEDNSKLNSIVGHDEMTINIKYKSSFTIRSNAMLIMGTNKPVKITDAKAGSTRRLIDVHPTGAKIEVSRYHILVEQVNYELGALAHKCLERYRHMGKFYYDGYVPTKMMMLTDHFYNFVEAHIDVFKYQDSAQFKQIWDLYKAYCEDANISKRLQYHEVKDELSNYFEQYHDRYFGAGKEQRSVYTGFKGLPEAGPQPHIPDTSYVIQLEEYDPEMFRSAFDNAYSEQPAQLGNEEGKPAKKWINVDTTLADINVTQLHYVKVPEQHIVLDFDLKGESGEKDLALNLEAASKFPPTYTELSQSGKGVHLHYVYKDDVSELAAQISDGIEIKTLLGGSGLRRRLTMCNSVDISVMNSGLPKKEIKMLDSKIIQTERGIRALIERNLRKEIHPGTKSSVDFIKKILDDAYNEGVVYDLTDMRPIIIAFAAKSTNQSLAALRVVKEMKFASETEAPIVPEDDAKPLVFFDVEVYPNLFVVCWKPEGDSPVVRMINPTSAEIEELFSMRLVGFNVRRYDNHILYARYLGYTLAELYQLSQRIINSGNEFGHLFGKAYNLSYADIYEFSSKKQGLKKFQIELGLNHQELDLPWDQDVPDDMWDKVVEYCVNDVLTTEGVFADRYQDFVARQILAELSGLSVNHTTRSHTAKIIFGDDKNPQSKFVYTDLSEEFPGYRFDGKESTYHDEVTGEGGYVYSEPGVYSSVALLDIASMHPTTIERLNLFGPYTHRYSELKEARMAIKHKDYDKARTLLDGKLGVFLGDAEDDPEGAEALAYALKIVINIVYGLTKASFNNEFLDRRNLDNIVAKRGALFMIDLKDAVFTEGYEVCHIKTDSIKIPNADQYIIDFVIDFGKQYGYDFEHEKTYDKFCLVNDAVYVAKAGDQWTAVGAQFQHPYVFKELFTHEELTFNDLCETKNVVQGTMYLDKFGAESIDGMQHVGRTGSFMPVRYDGGVLWRIKDGKKFHVTGTKDYMWVDRETAVHRDTVNELITDMDYFEALKNDAIAAIEQFMPSYLEFTEG